MIINLKLLELQAKIEPQIQKMWHQLKVLNLIKPPLNGLKLCMLWLWHF